MTLARHMIESTISHRAILKECKSEEEARMIPYSLAPQLAREPFLEVSLPSHALSIIIFHKSNTINWQERGGAQTFPCSSAPSASKKTVHQSEAFRMQDSIVARVRR